MRSKRTARFHAAIRLSEQCGFDAYHAVRDRFGEDVADALLIARLRRDAGSYDHACCCRQDDVEERVNEQLTGAGMLDPGSPEEAQG